MSPFHWPPSMLPYPAPVTRKPAWRESLKRIRDGEAYDRLARSARKEMENIKHAKQVQKHQQAGTKVPEAVVNEASRALRQLAINLDQVGLRGHKAAYLREVARNIVEPLREDV